VNNREQFVSDAIDRRAERVVRQALWGDDTHVDFGRSLNFCVAKLRSALRDNAAEPLFIEKCATKCRSTIGRDSRESRSLS
jgi:hypothetical protein